jgi:hypothetical protein
MDPETFGQQWARELLTQNLAQTPLVFCVDTKKIIL